MSRPAERTPLMIDLTGGATTNARLSGNANRQPTEQLSWARRTWRRVFEASFRDGNAFARLEGNRAQVKEEDCANNETDSTTQRTNRRRLFDEPDIVDLVDSSTVDSAEDSPHEAKGREVDLASDTSSNSVQSVKEPARAAASGASCGLRQSALNHDVALNQDTVRTPTRPSFPGNPKAVRHPISNRSPPRSPPMKKRPIPKEGSSNNPIDCDRAPIQKRRLVYRTCRDKRKPLDVPHMQRTIPVKDELYFCTSGQKKLFEIHILSMNSSVLMGQIHCGIKGDNDTTMSDVRNWITSVVRTKLDVRDNWEFFLPESGALLKRELEPLVSLREYMDECSFGRRLLVRLVSEHAPAVVELIPVSLHKKTKGR